MDLIRKTIQSNRELYEISLKFYSKIKGIEVEFAEFINIKKQNKVIILRKSHINHVRGVVDYFDFFHSSVKSQFSEGKFLVDFSTLKRHEVDDFVLKEVFMPSIAEPVRTAEIYAQILQIQDGMTVIDLGSYAGITGIYFNELVKNGGGKTICVEPDPENYQALQYNLDSYRKLTGSEIGKINAAIWKQDGIVNFVSEGSMDSAILGNATNLMVRSNHIKTVEAIKLSTLVETFKLSEVDCIKADIEGSELDAFQDDLFFRVFHPKIIIEPISMHGKRGANAIESHLKKYGYVRKDFPQEGARVPLILFI